MSEEQPQDDWESWLGVIALMLASQRLQNIHRGLKPVLLLMRLWHD
jgi:hypothetical protein